MTPTSLAQHCGPDSSAHRSSRRLLLSLLLLLALPACSLNPGASEPAAPQVLVGPERGALVLAGGGSLGPEIWQHFVDLAGGTEARIVVIPTAGASDDFDLDDPVVSALRAAGAASVELLHTRDRTEADSRAFTRSLRQATGVWIPGGRQWRLVDAYLHTRVHHELDALLERGGVVGGTSAGASIQASYLVRGDPATNQVLMAEGYEEGFGFLEGTAVDQHLHDRGREHDLWELLAVRPDLLGIGIDEGTALIVRGDRADVIGVGSVAIYDPSLTGPRFDLHRAGDGVDLAGHSPRRSAPDITGPSDNSPQVPFR